jgi:hypothetical protein
MRESNRGKMTRLVLQLLGTNDMMGFSLIFQDWPLEVRSFVVNLARHFGLGQLGNPAQNFLQPFWLPALSFDKHPTDFIAKSELLVCLLLQLVKLSTHGRFECLNF